MSSNPTFSTLASSFTSIVCMSTLNANCNLTNFWDTLAIAEVSKTGELLSYQTISLHHLLGLSQNSKDHQEWILAHQLLDLAIQKGKAIAVENLKKRNSKKECVEMGKLS